MSYRANVLVVDDEHIVCNSCRKILKQKGHNVNIALNGREALKKVEEDKYDAVIADWKMPDIDGMEVLRIVKKNHPDIILIMITGYASVESAVKAMRLGVSNYLPKPFTPETLSETLKNALEERKTDKKELFYYQTYIWARLLDDGTVKIGINNLFRERIGDILYVDLPFNPMEIEQKRLCIRILASDKQVHKLYAPIRGRVIKTNYAINFNTDLINKDPFGKGWIVQIKPSNLKEDLKDWSGDISVLNHPGKDGLNSQNREITKRLKSEWKTEVKAKENLNPNLPENKKDKPKVTIWKVTLSALASRLFFLSLLLVSLGMIIKAFFYHVSPQRAN